ncbi:hypothetical protein FH972_024006 [Carpinus fangiana]|uniref:Uncharacterized protein n=1 Tax=Carpinus fangiana TaxID=176857 RepID=A0A5N6KWS9_9ROSI|nr:hypothetical protein FH972_024006 [Carpinus fangiana]
MVTEFVVMVELGEPWLTDVLSPHQSPSYPKHPRKVQEQLPIGLPELSSTRRQLYQTSLASQCFKSTHAIVNTRQTNVMSSFELVPVLSREQALWEAKVMTKAAAGFIPHFGRRCRSCSNQRAGFTSSGRMLQSAFGRGYHQLQLFCQLSQSIIRFQRQEEDSRARKGGRFQFAKTPLKPPSFLPRSISIIVAILFLTLASFEELSGSDSAQQASAGNVSQHGFDNDTSPVGEKTPLIEKGVKMAFYSGAKACSVPMTRTRAHRGANKPAISESLVLNKNVSAPMKHITSSGNTQPTFEEHSKSEPTLHTKVGPLSPCKELPESPSTFSVEASANYKKALQSEDPVVNPATKGFHLKEPPAPHDQRRRQAAAQRGFSSDLERRKNDYRASMVSYSRRRARHISDGSVGSLRSSVSSLTSGGLARSISTESLRAEVLAVFSWDPTSPLGEVAVRHAAHSPSSDSTLMSSISPPRTQTLQQHQHQQQPSTSPQNQEGSSGRDSLQGLRTDSPPPDRKRLIPRKRVHSLPHDPQSRSILYPFDAQACPEFLRRRSELDYRHTPEASSPTSAVHHWRQHHQQERQVRCLPGERRSSLNTGAQSRLPQRRDRGAKYNPGKSENQFENVDRPHCTTESPATTIYLGQHLSRNERDKVSSTETGFEGSMPAQRPNLPVAGGSSSSISRSELHTRDWYRPAQTRARLTRSRTEEAKPGQVANSTNKLERHNLPRALSGSPSPELRRSKWPERSPSRNEEEVNPVATFRGAMAAAATDLSERIPRSFAQHMAGWRQQTAARWVIQTRKADAMRRGPAPHVHADGADLVATARPHARVGGALADDAEAGEGGNDGALEQTHVVARAEGVALEVEHGVGDELAGAMEGGLAAAQGGDGVGALGAAGGEGDGGAQVGLLGGGEAGGFAAAGGVDGGELGGVEEPASWQKKKREREGTRKSKNGSGGGGVNPRRRWGNVVEALSRTSSRW